MKIFKIITISTVANGFKLLEDTDYFKGELTTTTTATTTADTTTTPNTPTKTAAETVTEYGDAQWNEYGDEYDSTWSPDFGTTTTDTTTTTTALVNDWKLFRQNFFKLPERLRQEYEDKRTTTTATTTETTTTTDTTTSDTTTTETVTNLEKYSLLRNGKKLQRWQDIATKTYDEYVCMILRRLGQQSSDCSDLKARDSVIETPKLELRSVKQSH